jgi:signal transduction histidine kinase/DNA-binding response OmpR family regulator
MKNFDYYSILAQNISGLEVLLIDNSYKVLWKLGTEAHKQGWEGSNEANNNVLKVFPKEIKEILAPLLKIGFESTPISREFEANGNYFSVRIIPLKEAYNESLCILILQNITETKLAEKKLKKLMIEAREANKAKDSFVAKMSHEFRTPLHAISGFTEQLEKTRLTKKQSDYLNIVSNASRHLLSMIDDILVLSKIESGQIDQDQKPFSVKKTLQEVNDVLKMRYNTKELDFRIENKLPDNTVLFGDVSKLRQILINLANNAIKFTKKGSITIECYPIEDTKYQQIIEFRIEDTGVGIPRDEIKNIFNPFHQVNISTGRKYAGCGLGLTISKDLVESLGGNIDVESEPGKGTTFRFSVVFKKALESDLESYEAEQQSMHISLSNVRILFVDDDPVNLLLGKIILKKFGIKADFSNSGKDALKKYKKEKYDIIFLDINMPDMSGLEVSGKIRKREKNLNDDQKTRIIAMTANSMKKDIETYVKAGMDSVIIKPYQEETLYQRIAAYAKKDNLLTVTEPTKIPANESSNINPDDLLNFTKGDTEFTILMLDTFLDSTRHSLKKIRSAFRLNDYNTIAEIAHKLIPSVEQLGMIEGTYLLKKIENRYLRKKNFEKDPLLIEEAIEKLQEGIQSVSTYKSKIMK